jgi:phosphate transport system permease protein
MNTNPTQGPMVSLPLAIFQFVKSPEPTMVARGFGTAAVLMLLVLTLFVIARVVGGSSPLKKDARHRARQARRAERAQRHRPRRRTKRPAPALAPQDIPPGIAQDQDLPEALPQEQP